MVHFVEYLAEASWLCIVAWALENTFVRVVFLDHSAAAVDFLFFSFLHLSIC